MPALIKATYILEKKAFQSGIATSALSARHLLDVNKISDDSVDLFINVGVFRDENIFEPAIATLIQKQAHIGLLREPEQSQILSFDLNNSSCGFLNAVEVVNAFFDTGDSVRAIIVAGDYHPGNALTDGTADADTLPYASVGASVLLEHTNEPHVGFGPVYVDSVYDESDEAYIDFRVAGKNGRHSMSIVSSGTLHEKSMDIAAQLAFMCFDDIDRLDRRKVLLITAPYSLRFAKKLGNRIGLSENNISNSYRFIKDSHTSALALSYHDLNLDRGGRQYDYILFVSVGVGITAAAAIYVLP